MEVIIISFPPFLTCGLPVTPVWKRVLRRELLADSLVHPDEPEGRLYTARPDSLSMSTRPPTVARNLLGRPYMQCAADDTEQRVALLDR